MMTNKRIIAICLVSLMAIGGGNAAEKAQKPKLIVNIVVSQMRYDYLQRFSHNFEENGFLLFSKHGINCTNARYSYTGNNTPAGISTIVSGTNPDTHGIVSDRWIDYTTNKSIDVIRDENYYGVGCVETDGQYAPTKISVSTLGDEIKRHNPLSKVMSVALNPESAIIAGGTTADAAYWFDIYRGRWVTSTYYGERLPNWIEGYNDEGFADNFSQRNWNMILPPSSYVYSEKSSIASDSGKKFSLSSVVFSLESLFKRREKTNYSVLKYTPIGVDMLMEFTKKAIVYENLGKDNYPDLLMITVDPTRSISENYGTQSIEIEDAYYRLDKNIADIVNFIDIQLGKENVLFVLTSDHGSSDTYRESEKTPSGLFNTMQFKVLMNGFLNTQYGSEDWVVDYNNRNLYLNRRIVYEKGLNLAEMQTKMASFALQFRGLAQAITATSLQNNHFSGGAMQKIQNGYYPKNSGDLVLNFMPGWIEEQEGKISLTGSIYEYDTHVPLMWYIPSSKAETIEDNIDMRDVAPTISRITGVNKPDAATGNEIIKIVSKF